MELVRIQPGFLNMAGSAQSASTPAKEQQTHRRVSGADRISSGRRVNSTSQCWTQAWASSSWLSRKKWDVKPSSPAAWRICALWSSVRKSRQMQMSRLMGNLL